MPDDTIPGQTCPYCGGRIPTVARECDHCHLMLPSRLDRLFDRVDKRSVFFIALPFIILLMCYLFWPEPEQGHRRMSPCKRNLKTIALALHNYHDRWDS